MKQSVKELWIEALLSDEYEQGFNVLTEAGMTCCLGVLCEVAVREGVVSRHELCSDNDGTYGYGEEVEVAVLPWEVREWAGLDDDEDPVIRTRVDGVMGDKYLLTELNDEHHFTFPRIAALIEEQL